MLADIYIKDFALIKEARISFGSTLNIITGETGAGKSIILGALGLVLGSKATTDLIRAGSGRSLVEASFLLGSADKYYMIRRFLDENALDSEDDYIILKREITTEGRGRSFINGRQVSISMLKEIGGYLVDIHGQNEHQNILKITTHQSILDKYAGIQSRVKEITKLYKTRQELKQKLISVSLSEEEKNRRLEILSHEIKEIEEAELSEESEIDELISKEKTLSHAEAILSDLSSVYNELKSSENSILSKMTFVENLLNKNSQFDSEISDILNSYKEAFYLLEDTAQNLRLKRESIMIDPEQLSMVRDRLDILQNLIRKYGKSITEIKVYLQKAQREYEGIELSSEEALKTKIEIDKIEKEMISIAEELSIKRRDAAESLEKKVKEELKALGMENTRLRISIKWEYGENGIYVHEKNPEKKYIIGPAGLDIVEILIAASENDTLRPLRKIASGGEMSRIMLALKKIIIDTDPVFSMVFDEVDAGVGGRIAEAVGNKLQEVSKNSQVIVITHLHQIASLNTNDIAHFKVTKDKDAGTKIFRLNHEQRINEIARMVGGQQITDSAILHAKTILKN